MTAWLPLRYARRNLLIGPGGQTAALYRLPTVSYPFLADGEKRRWLRTMERLATVVGADFSVYRVARAVSPERYVQEATTLVDPRTPSAADFAALLDQHHGRLAALAADLPEVYLVVALPDERNRAGLGASFVQSVDRARRRLEDLSGVASPQPLGRGELRALANREQRTYEQLRAVTSIARASTIELEWLLRRASVRGLGEPRMEPHWAPDALIVDPDDPNRTAYEPLGHDLWRLLNAPITEPTTAPTRLVVETEQGDSHQALLAVGALADEAPFPGSLSELLYAPLEGVAFAVDAVIHCEWIGNSAALSQVRKRITDVEQVHREQAESVRGAGYLQEEDRQAAREYEAILESSGHPPMLRASISLALGAGDRVELERRVDALREQYGVIQLHRPRGLQEALWLDHLPRPDGGRVRDYVQQMTVQQFGALMPVGTQQVGSDPGIYLGVSGGAGGRPVRYDPTAPSRQARTSAVLLAGTLGSGKTVAAELIAYLAQARGSLVVDIDPKPDHAFAQIPQLADRVDVLELSGAPGQRGTLDPLKIGVEELREELAASYYLDLLRDPPPSWETQIQRAVRDVLRDGGRSSLLVIERLRSFDSQAALDVADALEVVADFGLARLGFGDATSAQLAEASAAVTTIRTPGLTLPDPRAARETYTRSERVSVATLALVAAFALRLVSGDMTRHKVVLLDEAWFLLSSSQGRSLIDRLVRLGRAQNATVLLATQRLEDVGDLSDLVGTFFMFGQESDREAQAALRLLDLDPDDPGLVARLREFRTGRCLMRDLDGRVADVQIDPAIPGLLQALDTTPKAARA